jgi:uracil-DNA glycosylase
MTSTGTVTTRTYTAAQVTWRPVGNQTEPRTSYQASTELSDYAVRAGATVQPVQLTVSVGQAVQVWAFGRPRPGVVTGLGRTRIEVEFQQNAQGTRSTRKFPVADLLAGGMAHDGQVAR